jgi:hypothetical protein
MFFRKPLTRFVDGYVAVADFEYEAPQVCLEVVFNPWFSARQPLVQVEPRQRSQDEGFSMLTYFWAL